VDRGVSLSESIALQHIEQRCLAGIVQSEEDYVSTLLEEAQPLKCTLEEIDYEHLSE